MIISRYLLREVLYTLLAVTGVMYIIYVSNRFLRILADSDTANLSADIIFQILALKSISNLVMLLPLSVFFSLMLAFGRLYQDSEMLVLSACGVSSGRLLRIILGFALLCASIVAMFSLYLGPWAEEKAYQIQDREQASADIRDLSAGQFREMRDGKLVFYVEELSSDQQTLSKVFVESRRGDELNVVTADHGYQYVDGATGNRYLVLKNGYRYEGEPGQANFKMIQFEEQGLLIEEKEIVPVARKYAAKSSALLWSGGSRAEMAELHWRIAMPIATVLLALLAVPLSKTQPRQGRYARLFAAVLVYVIYANLLAVGRSWLDQGAVPGVMGLWWVHILMVLLILGYLVNQSGWTWVMIRLRGKSARQSSVGYS